MCHRDGALGSVAPVARQGDVRLRGDTALQVLAQSSLVRVATRRAASAPSGPAGVRERAVAMFGPTGLGMLICRNEYFICTQNYAPTEELITFFDPVR